MRYSFSIVFLISFTLLLWGCDSSSNKPDAKPATYSPQHIAQKHNSAVKEYLSQKDTNKITRKYVKKNLRQTSTIENLPDKIERKELQLFRKDISKRSGRKSVIKNVSLENLHEADIISEKQLEYIKNIKECEDREKAIQIYKSSKGEIGKYSKIVGIYAHTYASSLSLWKNNKDKIKDVTLADKNAPIRVRDDGEVDGGAIAGADAAGAAVGAVTGAYTAIQSGAAQSSLVMGPQGAIVTTTGSALSYAVYSGAAASITEAGSQAGSTQ